MSIHIQALRVVIEQASTRAIHPDFDMYNSDFVYGYSIGLRNGLHRESPKDKPFTDESMIQAIRDCVAEEPEGLPYVLGCYIGSIIATCHQEGEKPHEPDNAFC